MTTSAAVSTPQSRVPVQWLPLLRLSAVVILVLVDICFVLGIPYFYTHLTTLCTLPNCAPLVLTANDVTMLEAAGLTASAYALIQIGIEVANLIFVNLFCIYYLRRLITHWLGYVASLMFIVFILQANVVWSLFDAFPQYFFLGDLLFDIAGTSMFTMLYILPSGRFVPRWSFLFMLLGLWEMWTRSIASYYPESFSGTQPSQFLGPFTSSLLFGLAFQAYRYVRVSTATERKQTRWVLAAMLSFISGIFGWGFFMEYLAYEPDAPRVWIHLIVMPVLMVISTVPVTLALTLSIVEHRLWEIDLIINRTLVYAVLTAVVVIMYFFALSLLNLSLGVTSTVLTSLIMTAILVVSFQWLRDYVQRFVNRLMFGQRGEPQAVMLELSRQLHAAVLPQELLETSVTTITRTLKLPYAAIAVWRGGERVMQIESGTNRTPTRSLPLVYQNETVGELVIGQRSPGEALNRADQVVLEGIAQQLGAVVFAVRTQSDLQTARERLVITREEERRRIRRDLHDGLGPALASLPLRLDAAIDLIDNQPRAAVDLLDGVKRQTQALVADVRRVVHDLRPPALDELGLAAALRSALAQLQTHPDGLRLTLDADGLPPDLPAAAEAAAYRIIMEAVTNVFKHAQATHCRIVLRFERVPSRLTIVVEDDGKGMPSVVLPNVGLHSMRERAEELGGTFHLQPRDAGGTRITVALPLSDTGGGL
jgi:signal transduction histidine kinase